MAASTFFSVLLYTATSPNFDQALVPRVDDVEPYLDTLWVTTLVQGLFLTFVYIAMARPFASFFHIEDSYKVFWYCAPMDLLMAIKSPGSTPTNPEESGLSHIVGPQFR